MLSPLSSTLFFKPPPGQRAAFEQEIAYDNFQRARVFAWIVALMNGLVGAIPDQLWRVQGKWRVELAYVWWSILHDGMLLFALASWLILRAKQPAEPAAVRPVHRRLVRLFCLGTLAGMLGITLVHQHITGGATVLVLGMACYGACFFSRPGESLAVLGSYAAIFIVALPWLSPNPASIVSHSIVAANFALCFWLASCLIYSLRARDFVHLHTIAEQTQRLERINEDLRQANALKTELIGIAAHDLRDPLNSVGAIAQELRVEVPPDSGARALVDAIGDSTRRMAGLIDNLLTDAARDSGCLILRKETLDVAHLVSRIVDEHRWAARPKALQLLFTPPASGISHAVDPLRFRQILENLLGNAIKFSTPAHRIWITLEAAAPPDRGLRLAVRDEGPGVPVAEQPFLFTKFRPLSARPTGGEPTTGLGLAIVKNLVDLHQGRVWFESAAPAPGSTFVVELP